MLRAQCRDGQPGLLDIGLVLQPHVETRILTHFRMALQREDVAAAPEGLMGIAGAGREQLGALGQVEGVAMPVKDRDT